MTAELVGNVSIGEVVPTTASLVAAAVADLQAKLTGALAAQVSIGIKPPTLAASIESATALLVSLQAQLALGLPEVSVNLTVMASVIADLSAQVAALLALSVALGTAGVFVFTHTGNSVSYGTEMQAQISGVSPPGNTIRSVTFMCSDPTVFEALGKVLLTG